MNNIKVNYFCGNTYEQVRKNVFSINKKSKLFYGKGLKTVEKNRFSTFKVLAISGEEGLSFSTSSFGSSSFRGEEPNSTNLNRTGVIDNSNNRGFSLNGFSQKGQTPSIITYNNIAGVFSSFLGPNSKHIYDKIITINGNDVSTENLLNGYSYTFNHKHVVYKNLEASGVTVPKSCNNSNYTVYFQEGVSLSDPELVIQGTTEMNESPADFVCQLEVGRQQAESSKRHYIPVLGVVIPGATVPILDTWFESQTKGNFDVTFLMYTYKVYSLATSLVRSTVGARLEINNAYDPTVGKQINVEDPTEFVTGRIQNKYQDTSNNSSFTLIVPENMERQYARLLKFILLDRIPFSVRTGLQGTPWYLTDFFEFEDICSITNVNVLTLNVELFNECLGQTDMADLFGNSFSQTIEIFNQLVPRRNSSHHAEGFLLSALTIFSLNKMDIEGEVLSPKLRFPKKVIPPFVGVYQITQPQTGGYIKENISFKEFNAMQVVWYLKFKTVVFSSLEYILGSNINSSIIDVHSNQNYKNTISGNVDTVFSGAFSNDSIWQKTVGSGFNYTFVMFCPGLIRKYIDYMYTKDLSQNIDEGGFVFREPFPITGFEGNNTLPFSKHSEFIGKRGIVEVVDKNLNGIKTNNMTFNSISILSLIEGYLTKDRERIINYNQIPYKYNLPNSESNYSYEDDYGNSLLLTGYDSTVIHIMLNSVTTDMYEELPRRLDGLRGGETVVKTYASYAATNGRREYTRKVSSGSDRNRLNLDSLVTKLLTTRGIISGNEIFKILTNINQNLLLRDKQAFYMLSQSKGREPSVLYINTKVQVSELRSLLTPISRYRREIRVYVNNYVTNPSREVTANQLRAEFEQIVTSEYDEQQVQDSYHNQEKFYNFIDKGLFKGADEMKPINRPEKTVDNTPLQQKTVVNDMSDIIIGYVFSGLILGYRDLFFDTGDEGCVRKVLIQCIKDQFNNESEVKEKIKIVNNVRFFENTSRVIMLIKELKLNVYFCLINDQGKLNNTLFKIGKQKTKNILLFDEYNLHVTMIREDKHIKLWEQIISKYPEIKDKIKLSEIEQFYMILHLSYKEGVRLKQMANFLNKK